MAVKINGVWYRGECKSCGKPTRDKTKTGYCKSCWLENSEESYRLRAKNISATKQKNGVSKKWLKKCKGPGSVLYKEKDITYSGAHQRVSRYRKKRGVCEECGCNGVDIIYDWANISGKYWDVDDYRELCRSCHIKQDRNSESFAKKLTMKDAEDIRKVSKYKTNTDIANQYGVSLTLVGLILKGSVWHKE